MVNMKYLITLILLVSVGSGALEPYSRPNYFTFGTPEGFEVVKDTSETVIMINEREIIQIGFNYSVITFEKPISLDKVQNVGYVNVEDQEVDIYRFKNIYFAMWFSDNTLINVMAQVNDTKPLFDFLESFTYRKI